MNKLPLFERTSINFFNNLLSIFAAVVTADELFHIVVSVELTAAAFDTARSNFLALTFDCFFHVVNLTNIAKLSNDFLG